MSNARDKANIPALNFSSTGIDDNATSTAITIDSSERVGIGTSSPVTNLHISSTGTPVFRIQDADGSDYYAQISQATGNTIFDARFGTSNGAFLFRGLGGGVADEYMRIDTSGNVGIGTSSPDARLSLGSLIPTNGQTFHVYHSGFTRSGLGVRPGVYRNYTSSDAVLSFGHVSIADGSTYAERMRIDSSGNVGIGTSSPSVRLDARIATLTGKVVEFHNSGGFGIGFTVESNGGVNTINSESNQALAFATNGASNERMRIDSSGKLLHGFSSSFSNGRIQFYNPNGASNYGLQMAGETTGGSNQIEFLTANSGSYTPCGTITTSGSSTTYGTTSDYRLKENNVNITDGIDRVKLLKPYRFNFIAYPDKTVDGFFAHEVQDIVPEAITETKDAVDDEGNPKYQNIDQSKLVPLLTSALQEAITKIESLEAKVQTLENNQP